MLLAWEKLESRWEGSRDGGVIQEARESGPCVDRCRRADEGIVGTGLWSESCLVRYPNHRRYPSA